MICVGNEDKTLKNVWLIDKGTHNLISVSAMTKQLQTIIVLDYVHVYIAKRINKTTLDNKPDFIGNI